jgi:membrane associated rhomboid family serine protease
MKWLNKLERNYGHIAINNLMKYIVGLNVLVYILRMIDYSIVYKLSLIPQLVMRGEIWRLVTFVFIPPNTSMIFIFFVLYFYYMIGKSLEHEWGSFKFNIYYLFGIIGAIIASFITGSPATATYLNLTLFLAFSYIYPDFTIRLFFILPLKVKYLSYVYWIFTIWKIVTGSLGTKIFIIFSLINVLIFFGKDYIFNAKNRTKTYYRKRGFQSQIREAQKEGPVHKCTVCGITEKDDPNMEFRYCMECEGYYEYCMEHLKTHEHIKEENITD